MTRSQSSTNWEITYYSKVVCKVQPEKGNTTDQTHITIGSNNIAYPRDDGTPPGSIELVKILINSVLSQHNTWLATMDLKDFYLNTPLDWPEYVCINFTNIPTEFIAKDKLKGFVCNCWVYFKMRCSLYGLPQAGILANNLLWDRLAKFDYYEAATTPGLWHHKWYSVVFALIVDDFTLQYVGNTHLDHLCQALRKHYKVAVKLDGTCFASTTLKWKYSPIHIEYSCCLSIPGYICNVHTKYSTPCLPSTNSLLTSITK
jgi:hypothetical protein